MIRYFCRENQQWYDSRRPHRPKKGAGPLSTPPLPPISNTPPFQSKIVRLLVSAIVERAGALSTSKTRHGGYLYVLHKDGTAICDEFGRMDETKQPRFRALSEEKCRRLARHPGHQSSWQSKNENKEQFAGAIRASRTGTIIGFSGRLWLEDEAICLTFAVNMEWLTIGEALQIASISGNAFFARHHGELTTACRRNQ